MKNAVPGQDEYYVEYTHFDRTYREKTDGTEHRFTQKRKQDEIISPKCEEQGYTVKYCDDCGAMAKTDYTEPTGHFFDKDRQCTV